MEYGVKKQPLWVPCLYQAGYAEERDNQLRKKPHPKGPERNFFEKL